MRYTFFLVSVLSVTINCAGMTNAVHHGLAVRDAHQGKWDAAAPRMMNLVASDHTNPNVLYDAGVVAYKNKQYEQARAYFQQAGELASLPALKERALFNLGNTYVDLKRYPDALKAYEDVLAINPDNTYAKHNRDKVRELLEQQKQQEEEKKNEQQDNQQQPDNKDDNQDQKNKDNQSGNGDQDNQSQQNGDKGDSKDQSQGGGDENDGQDGQNGDESSDKSDDQSKDGNKSGADKQERDGEKNNQKKDGSQDGNDQGKKGQQNTDGSGDSEKDQNDAAQNKSGQSEQQDKDDKRNNDGTLDAAKQENAAEENGTSEEHNGNAVAAAQGTDEDLFQGKDAWMAQLLQSQEMADKKAHIGMMKTALGSAKGDGNDQNCW
jgi:tetratricopeptide (TPR) repeat protein